MTVTLLPRDADDRTIPAMRLRPGAAQTLAISTTSVRSTQFNAETRVIGVYATVPVFVRLGDNTVTATSSDHYIPADTYMDIAIGGGVPDQYGYAAFIRSSSDGTVYISEKF
ncbi:MAG TPA: hypothetical protein VGF14_04915 [Alphaproteobacteria bacterium]